MIKERNPCIINPRSQQDKAIVQCPRNPNKENINIEKGSRPRIHNPIVKLSLPSRFLRKQANRPCVSTSAKSTTVSITKTQQRDVINTLPDTGNLVRETARDSTSLGSCGVLICVQRVGPVCRDTCLSTRDCRSIENIGALWTGWGVQGLRWWRSCCRECCDMFTSTLENQWKMVKEKFSSLNLACCL